MSRPERYVAEFGGIVDVYNEIFHATDCAEVQSRFDVAADNADRDSARGRWDLHRIDIGYMRATDERLRELGCYD